MLESRPRTAGTGMVSIHSSTPLEDILKDVAVSERNSGRQVNEQPIRCAVVNNALFGITRT